MAGDLSRTAGEALFQRGPPVVQQLIQREGARRRPRARGDIVVIRPLELLLRIALELRQVDPLPHRRRETLCGILLKRHNFAAPVGER